MPRNESKNKSVRKIKKIFLCIFNFIWKSDISSTYLNFDEKWFFGHFKSQISKCPNHIRILPHVLHHRKPSGQFHKQILLDIHSWTPCSMMHRLTLNKFHTRYILLDTASDLHIYAWPPMQPHSTCIDLKAPPHYFLTDLGSTGDEINWRWDESQQWISGSHSDILNIKRTFI